MNEFPATKWNHVRWSSYICLFLLINACATESKTFLKHENEWTITFYTGPKIWSGTDSIINVQIYGSKGRSNILQIMPMRLQMEARSIDQFSLGSLDQGSFGIIQSISIIKEHSYAFFNDWELLKVELTDPTGKVYQFNCNCWLTTLKYKRNIELFAVNGVELHEPDEGDMLRQKRLRIFPITVMFLLLVIFVYFSYFVFKKWRENSHYFSENFSRRRRSRRNRASRNRGISRPAATGNDTNEDDLYKTDDEDDLSGNLGANRSRIYNVTNDLNNVDTNRNLTRPPPVVRVVAGLGGSEDKPPDYKELFPMEIVSQEVQADQSNSATTTTRLTNF